MSELEFYSFVISMKESKEPNYRSDQKFESS